MGFHPRASSAFKGAQGKVRSQTCLAEKRIDLGLALRMKMGLEQETQARFGVQVSMRGVRRPRFPGGSEAAFRRAGPGFGLWGRRGSQGRARRGTEDLVLEISAPCQDVSES